MDSILSFDTWISQLLSDLIPHNAFFNTVFSFLSLQGNWIALWAIAVFILFFTEIRQDKRFLIYFMLSAITTVVIVDVVMKNVIRRNRPWVAQRLTETTCPRTYSFPSTHAAGSFAGATILVAFDKKRAKFYYLTAFLISFSRIYLLCHYFFDVLAGGIIGYTISKSILLVKIGKKPIE